MKKLLRELNSIADQVEQIPGMAYALIVSAVFVLLKNSLILNFSGQAGELLREIPTNPLALALEPCALFRLIAGAGVIPGLLLAALKQTAINMPIGVRFLILLLHAANACLLYKLTLTIFTRGRMFAFVTALLFALAPVNTGALLQPLNLGELMAVTLIFWGALEYHLSREFKIIPLFTGAALLCSPIGLMIPVVYPLLPGKEDLWRELRIKYITVCLIAAATLKVSLTVLTSDSLGAVLQTVKNIWQGNFEFLSAAVIPFNSPLIFPSLSRAERLAGIIPALLILVAATVTLWKTESENREPILPLSAALLVPYAAGFTGGLPESGIMSYYAAGTAVFWLLAAAAQDIIVFFGKRRLAFFYAPVLALCAVVFVFSFRNLAHAFRNEQSFMETVASAYPSDKNRNSYAQFLINEGKSAQALQVLAQNTAREVFENRTKATALAGQAYLQARRYRKAETYFRQLLALDPASVDARTGMSELYKERKQFAMAVAIADSGLEKNSDDPRLYYSKGFALLEYGKYANAFQSFDKACELDSRHCLFH